jgi:hypothetical protein
MPGEMMLRSLNSCVIVTPKRVRAFAVRMYARYVRSSAAGGLEELGWRRGGLRYLVTFPIKHMFHN